MTSKALTTRVPLFVLLFAFLLGVEATLPQPPQVSIYATGRVPSLPTGQHSHSWHMGNSTKTKSWAWPTVPVSKTHPATTTATSNPESTGSLACSPTPDSQNPSGNQLNTYAKGIFVVGIEEFCLEVAVDSIELGSNLETPGEDGHAPNLDISGFGPNKFEAGGLSASFSLDLVSGAGSFTVSRSTCLSALVEIVTKCQILDIPDSENDQPGPPWNLGGTITVSDGIGTVEFNASMKVPPSFNGGKASSTHLLTPLPT